MVNHDQTMLIVVDVNYVILPEVYQDRRRRFSQSTWTTACSPRHLLLRQTILFVVHVDQLIVFEDFHGHTMFFVVHVEYSVISVVYYEQTIILVVHVH